MNLKKRTCFFYLFRIIQYLGFTKLLSDECYLKLMYKAYVGKSLNIKKPVTFSEKIQWLKLYNRNYKFNDMVDKYNSKKYVSDIIGEQYIIPTIGVWDSFDEINFEILPEQFVLKCTHDSHSVYICKNKNSFNIHEAKKIIDKGLNRNGYDYGREWPYKNVKPRIIVEKYMENNNSTDLIDYKFFCFDGRPFLCQVFNNRRTNETIDFFDMNWNHIVLQGIAKPYKPFYDKEISKPLTFENMKKFAAILSRGIPFLRVDFYEIDGHLYYGELTFFPASGFGEFQPDEWNYELGNLIVLPDKK